jgi:hypothetical protein
MKVIDKAHCDHLSHNGHPLRSLFLQATPRSTQTSKPSSQTATNRAKLKLKLMFKFKQVLDMPLDMLGLELTFSTEAAKL